MTDKKEKVTLEEMKQLPYIEDSWEHDPDCGYDDACSMHDIYSPIETIAGAVFSDEELQRIISLLTEDQIPKRFHRIREMEKVGSEFHYVGKGLYLEYMCNGRSLTIPVGH